MSNQTGIQKRAGRDLANRLGFLTQVSGLKKGIGRAARRLWTFIATLAPAARLPGQAPLNNLIMTTPTLLAAGFRACVQGLRAQAKNAYTLGPRPRSLHAKPRTTGRKWGPAFLRTLSPSPRINTEYSPLKVDRTWDIWGSY